MSLLDSGANHSIVGSWLFSLIPGIENLLTPVGKEMTTRAINGRIVQYHQTLLLSMEFQRQAHDVHADYSEVLPYSLGMTALGKLK